MRVYHRTPNAYTILAEGFRDGEGSYLTSQTVRGVWVNGAKYNRGRSMRFSRGQRSSERWSLPLNRAVAMSRVSIQPVGTRSRRRNGMG